LKPQNINFVTNPHAFYINGIKFLGTSGQNIKDIRMFCDQHREPVDVMEHTLQIRHICPTSPDTLRAYSFTESDPFIVDDAPHVYFAGN
jgi:DNA polymerase delta subunit 2